MASFVDSIVATTWERYMEMRAALERARGNTRVGGPEAAARAQEAYRSMDQPPDRQPAPYRSHADAMRQQGRDAARAALDYASRLILPPASIREDRALPERPPLTRQEIDSLRGQFARPADTIPAPPPSVDLSRLEFLPRGEGHDYMDQFRPEEQRAMRRETATRAQEAYRSMDQPAYDPRPARGLPQRQALSPVWQERAANPPGESIPRPTEREQAAAYVRARGFPPGIPRPAIDGLRTFNPNDPTIIEATRRFDEAYARNPEQFISPTAPPLPRHPMADRMGNPYAEALAQQEWAARATRNIGGPPSGGRAFNPNDPATFGASRKFDEAYAPNPQQFDAPQRQFSPEDYAAFGLSDDGAPIDYLAGWSPWEPEIRVPRVQPSAWSAPEMPQAGSMPRFQPRWIDNDWSGWSGRWR